MLWGDGEGGRKEERRSILETEMCILLGKGSRKAALGCDGASMDASWTFSCARRELGERKELLRGVLSG